MTFSPRRRRALLLALAAVLITGTLAGLRAVGSDAPASSAHDDSVLTGSGTSTFGTGDVVVVDDRDGDGDMRVERAGVDGEASSPSGAAGQQRHDSFTVIVGRVSGLYPGKRQRLPVIFSNPLPYPIRIGTVTTTATGPRGCPIDSSLLLRPRTFSHLLIRTNRSQHKTLRFGMLKSATDACQNGAFTVTVSATAIGV
jgi:hypothetical protein